MKRTKPSAIIEEEGAFCSGSNFMDTDGDSLFRPLFFEFYTADGPLKIKTFHPHFPDNFDVSKYLHAYGLRA